MVIGDSPPEGELLPATAERSVMALGTGKMNSQRKSPHLAGLLVVLVSLSCVAGERSSAQRRAFMKAIPCPSTGKTRGACKGWVVDHRIALACGGDDHPSNMAWMTTEDARAKDKWERKGCSQKKNRP